MVKTMFLPVGLVLVIAGFLSISYKNSINLGSYMDESRSVNSTPSSAHLHGYFNVSPQAIHDNLSVEYVVDGAARVRLSLLDLSGRMVEELMDRNVGDGFFQTTFDISEKYIPGTYLVVIERNGKKCACRIRITG